MLIYNETSSLNYSLFVGDRVELKHCIVVSQYSIVVYLCGGRYSLYLPWSIYYLSNEFICWFDEFGWCIHQLLFIH